MIDRNLELLRPLEILKPKVEFNMPRCRRRCSRGGSLSQLGLERPFAIINPVRLAVEALADGALRCGSKATPGRG